MDTAWLTDPRTYFTGDYDMWAGHDGPIRYCTGFLAPKLVVLQSMFSYLKMAASQLVRHNSAFLNRSTFSS
jgi:hypothetical protein